MLDHTFKYAFLDLDFEPGRDYCKHLLGSGDFARTTLAAVPTPRGTRSGSKDELAAAVADAIVENNQDPLPLVIEFCRQSRSWLSFQVATRMPTPSADIGSARDFLTREKKTKWYGVWKDPERNQTWWAARVVHVRHFIPNPDADDGKPLRAQVRCNVVAEMTPRYVALHWNGFNYLEEVEAKTLSPFAYWKFVPGMFDELRQQVAFTSRFPDLNALVLDELLETYGETPDTHQWEHLKVRAEREGVVLNARGSRAKVQEINLRGLEALTRALATSAIHALGSSVRVSKENEKRVHAAVLRTLIKEWGTKSYEFALQEVGAGHEEPEKLFRGHCYFGNAADPVTDDDDDDDETADSSSRGGPDSFPHVLCYAHFGGSSKALAFLMEHLK